MRLSRLFPIGVCVTLLGPGCAAVSRGVDRAETGAANALLPIEQENQLGTKLAVEIESQVKLSSDASVIAFVERVGRKVIASSDDTNGHTFVFKVIDDPKTVNAFAIPGGNVYVYTGLLKLARNEAELAGVMGHEIAHVTQRHIAKRMVKTYGLQAMAELALGRNPGVLQQVATQIVGTGILLKNSRDDERAADQHGVVAMSKADYDPRAMVAFFSSLKASEGNSPAVLAYLSDHPATGERISNLESQISREHLAGATLDTPEFEAVKRAF